jgi:hypothetical protein
MGEWAATSIGKIETKKSPTPGLADLYDYALT